MTTWSNALIYVNKFNNVFNKYFNRDVNVFLDDRNALVDMLIPKNEDGIRDISRCNVENTVEDMNDYDVAYFSLYLKISQWNNLVIFKYDTLAAWNLNAASVGITSDNANDEIELPINREFLIYNKLLREFRGIVIDIKAMELVCTPFDKFANLNEYGWEENSMDNIINEFANSQTIEVSNKLDGSLQSLRWYNDNFVLSGSASVNPEASYQLGDSYEWVNLPQNKNYIDMVKDNPDDTHIFEWIAPNDAHVVVYTKEQKGLYLIGIRNSVTGEQYPYKTVLERANKYNVRTTTLYDMSLDDILANCKKFKSNEMEGYVVNLDGHRIKIKCDDYVGIVKLLKTASSPNEVVRRMVFDTLDDCLANIPEVYRPPILHYVEYIKLYISSYTGLIEEYYNNAPKDDIKTYMLYIQDTNNVPKFLFKYLVKMYKGQSLDLLGTKGIPEVVETEDGEVTEYRNAHIMKFSEISEAMGRAHFQTFTEWDNS